MGRGITHVAAGHLPVGADFGDRVAVVAGLDPGVRYVVAANVNGSQGELAGRIADHATGFPVAALLRNGVPVIATFIELRNPVAALLRMGGSRRDR